MEFMFLIFTIYVSFPFHHYFRPTIKIFSLKLIELNWPQLMLKLLVCAVHSMFNRIEWDVMFHHKTDIIINFTHQETSQKLIEIALTALDLLQKAQKPETFWSRHNSIILIIQQAIISNWLKLIRFNDITKAMEAPDFLEIFWQKWKLDSLQNWI